MPHGHGALWHAIDTSWTLSRARKASAFLTDTEQPVLSAAKRANGAANVGMCDGVLGDDRIHVTVDAENRRSLLLDGPSTSGFVQSKLRCKGKRPELFMGSCDDPLIRSAWSCQPELSNMVEGEAFPYVAAILRRMERKCRNHPMQVLMLGLGGGTMQSYMASTCPTSQLLTVEASPAVLAAAQRFFGFSGPVRLGDARRVLSDLATASERFDAIVVDIADTVLDRVDVEHLHTLLKDGGLVLHNHTNQQKMMEQLDAFRSIFPDAQQQSFEGGNASAISALRAGQTHYEAAGGSPVLRKAVAAHLERSRPGLKADPDQVLCMPGGKPVIYPNPGFPAYDTTIEWSGATPVPLHLDESTGFRFRHDDLRRLVSPRTKLIILCSPGNPTGGVLTSQDLDFVAGVAQESDAYILSDEIYSSLIFDGQHDSILLREVGLKGAGCGLTI
eukprot:s191_g33.t1